MVDSKTKQISGRITTKKRKQNKTLLLIYQELTHYTQTSGK